MRSHQEIVISQEGLTDLIDRLGRETVLAFDLEADSMHHYREKVCLIQVSSLSETVLIDPLALSDLSPLAAIFSNPAIRKVFHGADYDIRSLHRDYGIEVNNLFDTMIACQFLGQKEVGLAAVLKARFGVELDKKYQKADWSKRPLSEGMIEYAAKDTSMLIHLLHVLEEELKEKNRLSWVLEECELLSRVRSASRENEPFFLRVKGAASLDPRSLAALEELLRFRDDVARSRDVPSFKIMDLETIRELAVKKPGKPEELDNIPGLTPKLIHRYGHQIIDAVALAMDIPEEKLPHYPVTRRKRPNSRRDETLKKLKEWREVKAGELKLDGWIAANNTLLEELAEKIPSNVLELDAVTAMKRWQRHEFGEELTKILSSTALKGTRGKTDLHPLLPLS